MYILFVVQKLFNKIETKTPTRPIVLTGFFFKFSNQGGPDIQNFQPKGVSQKYISFTDPRATQNVQTFAKFTNFIIPQKKKDFFFIYLENFENFLVYLSKIVSYSRLCDYNGEENQSEQSHRSF